MRENNNPFSHLWLRRTYLALGELKKNKFSFCISLIII